VGSVVTYVDWMDGGNLAIRNLATGESRRLTDTADNGAGDNGGHYAVDSRISPDGERVLYSWARSSPAGETVELRVLAYSRSASRESPGKDILLVAVDGSRETTLVQHAAHDELVAWSRGGGHLLLTSDRSGQPGLWAQRVQDGKPVGEPHLVFTNVDVGAGLGIAADGTLHYAAKVTRRRMKIAELDTTTGRLLRPPANVVDRFVGGNSRGVFSPDGKSDGSVETLPREFPDRRFSLSPDGKWIATIAGQTGTMPEEMYGSQIRLQPVSEGEERLLSAGDDELRLGRWTTWLPDSRALLVLKEEPEAGRDMWRLWIVPVDGSEPVATDLVHEPANFGAIPLDIHPDGKRIVYAEGGYSYQFWALRNLPLDRAD